MAEVGVLLLAEGSVISERNLTALENRGVRKILVHRSEPVASSRSTARLLQPGANFWGYKTMEA